MVQFLFYISWEQRKAETLFISYVEKGFPALPVLSATQDKGMVYRDDAGKIVVHDKNNEIGYKRVQPGQFVIHLRSFQGGFAHSNILGITSPAYTIFGFKEGEKQYDLFWKCVFSSPNFIKRLESVTYGIRDGRSISYDEFLTMKFIIPEYKEQVKIATCLIRTDNLITLHQCEYFLCSYKNVYLHLQQSINKITNSWEQRKAETLFISYAEKGYPELPVLSATQDKGMVYRDDTGKNIFHDKSNEIGYKRVQPGQFVIHLRSFQGGFAHSAILGITSPAYTIFGVKEGEKQYDLYWKCVFSSPKFVKRLETVTYGIRDGRNISYDEFLTMDFLVPKYEEQLEIADSLVKIDNLITLHQRQLEKLKNIKSALLEKMFV